MGRESAATAGSKHILHLFSTFGPGGAELRVISFILRAGARFQHTIAAMNGDLRAAGRLGSVPQARILPGAVRRNRLMAPWHVRNLVRRLRPDLVVTYNWGSVDGLLGALLARVCEVIHTEDGFGADEAAGLKWRRVMARRLLLRKAWRTVVPSRLLERIALEQYRLTRSKVEFIPNGIDVERFRPNADRSARTELGIPQEDLVFGTVCNLRGEKNLGMMIRAFAAAGLEQSRLVIAGDGPKRMEWEAVAREAGCAGRVVFAGATADPAPYYAAMDVFLMSSVTEQMPTVLLEAMSCGLPALCTDVGDSAAILESCEAVEIVPSRDASAYARSLRILASEPELRARLGEKNRRLCLEKYSLDRMTGRYIDLYCDACRVRDKPPVKE
jgi:glycosyltransferase involved in cell wall biosynthesis